MHDFLLSWYLLSLPLCEIGCSVIEAFYCYIRNIANLIFVIQLNAVLQVNH